jgi:hypothetical protein
VRGAGVGGAGVDGLRIFGCEHVRRPPGGFNQRKARGWPDANARVGAERKQAHIPTSIESIQE